MKVKHNITYKDWCINCIHLDFSARLFQYIWRQYKNKQYEWKDEIIYRFINNFIINNNINKNALFQAFSNSKDFDCTTMSKMQNVLKVYNM